MGHGDGFPASVLKILAVGIERLRHLDHAGGTLALALLALHGLYATEQLGDDGVQLLVGLRLELAVFDDIRHLRRDFGSQCVVVSCRGLARMGRRQGVLDGTVHSQHPLAQRRINRPFFSRIEHHLLGRSAVVPMVVAGRGRCKSCNRTYANY